MSKIAMIGAGKTGRGFIGRLLAEDNKEILFVDKNAALVDALNKAGSFKVSFFGGVREPMTVSGYKAVTWEDADLSDITIIMVSVGGMNLKDVGAELRKLINDGKMRHIIVGENASHPAKTLSEAIGLDNITVSPPFSAPPLRTETWISHPRTILTCSAMQSLSAILSLISRLFVPLWALRTS